MKLREINRSPETEAAPVAIDYAKGFASLSDTSQIEVETSTETAAAEEAKPADTAIATTEVKSETVATETVTGTTNAQPKEGESEEDINPITEFKLPGEEVKTEEKTAEQIAAEGALSELEKESSWINIAKVNGFEIPENTFDAYTKGLNEIRQAEKEAAIIVAKKEAEDLKLDTLPVKAVMIIKGLETGKSMEQILAPIKQIETFEAMSDADLVAEDLKLSGWADEAIEKHMQDLIDEDRVDVAAQPLRVLLKTQKENIAKEQAENFSQMQLARENRVKEARTKESEQIKSSLVSMKTFLDVPITDKIVAHVQQKWNTGEYHESFKDPKLIAEFLMYKEFGDQGLKSLAQREYVRGRDEKAKKLHVIPPVQKTAGKINTIESKSAIGNFGALD